MSARLRRFVSRLTLAAFFGTFTLPVLAGVHLSWNDDPACADELGPRHDGAEFASQHTPIQAGHCTVCHWMRAVSGAAPRQAVTHNAHFTPRASHVPVVHSPYAHSVSLEQPSRAPPSVVSL